MNKTARLKKELVEALRKHLGIVSSACEALGINRTTYYKYYKNGHYRNKNIGQLKTVP